MYVVCSIVVYRSQISHIALLRSHLLSIFLASLCLALFISFSHSFTLAEESCQQLRLRSPSHFHLIVASLDDTLANSQLKTSFMDGGGGNIELNLYQERGENELVEIVWVGERERGH